MNIATAVTDQVFKVLLVEDNPGDARLVRELLRDTSWDSFEVTWVEHLSEAVARLADEAFDIILLGLSLPDTSGLDTLARMNNAARDLPIIVLTGQGDETLGIQALGKGAQDYLLKQNLDSPLLNRMLHYAIERKRVDQVERESEERFQALVQNSTDVITILAPDGRVMYESPSLERVMGYRPEAVQGLFMAAFVHPDDLPSMLDGMTVLLDEPATTFFCEGRVRHADGSWRTLEMTMTNLLAHPAIRGIVVNSRDITERRRSEEAIRFQAQLLNTVGQAVIASDLDNKIIYWNHFAEALYGWSAGEALGRNIVDITPADISREQAAAIMARLRVGERWQGEFTVQRRDGTTFPALVTDDPVFNEAGTLMGVIGVSMDITDRRRAEEALRESERRYRSLFENMLDGFAYCQMEFDQGRPQDFRYLDVNSAFETLTGLKDVVGKKVSEVIPGIQESNPELFASYGRVALTGQPETIEIYLARLSMWLSIAIYSPQKEYFVTVFEVITERKRAENALRQYNQRLGILHEIDRGILTAQPPQQIAERVAQALIELTHCGAVRIIALDSHGKTLPYLAAYPPASPTSQDLLGQAIENYGLPESFRRGEALLIDDTQTHERLWVGFEEILTAQGARAWIIAPLIAGVQLVGILAVGSLQPLAFTSDHIEVVHEVADQLAIALHKNHLDEQIQEHARRLEARVSERTEQLHSAKERSETILMSVSDAIMVANLEGSIQQVNTAFTVLFGYTLEQARTVSLYALLDSASGATVRRISAELAEGGKTQHVELVGLRQDGTLFDAEAAFAPVVDGLPTILICSIRDITERKRAERQLRYHASLQENVTDAVIASDLQFRIQSWNPAAERIYGWGAEEVLGRSIGDVLPTEFASDETGERIQTDFVEKGRWSDEIVQYHKDGRALHILSSTVLFKDENGQPFGIVAVNHDITEHKAAELILQAKTQVERAFQSALKELHEISLELTQVDSLDTFYRRVVESGLSHLGFERLALFLYDAPAGCAQGTYGTDQDGQIHDERALRITPNPRGIMMRALERAERFCLDESVPLLHDTKPMGLGWNAAAALWSGSRMVGWLVADNLIEQKPASKALMEIFALYALTVGTLLGQKQAVKALRESEEKFRLFVEAAPEAIVICNRQGTITLVNAEAEHTFGYHRAELIGQAVELLVPEVQREVHQRQRDRYAAAPSRRSGEVLPEFPARRKDGSQFPAEIQLSAVQTQNDLLVISFIADISERKRAEEALQRALEQQKELVDLKSRFISMASHDFRTPMTVILSSISLLEMQISRQFGAEHLEPLQKRLRRIDESVRQMTSLLDDVLTVNRADAGKVEVHAERLDVERLGEEFLQEIQLTTGTQHLLKFSFVGQASSIVSDPQLLRQILINLLSNAVKYSPEGGNVRLEVHCEPESVEFQVQDEGIGIPEPDQARLFEVFHRAHNVGGIRGTGLGMAIVKRAVDALGGTITFESQLGIGTTFSVRLPTALTTA